MGISGYHGRKGSIICGLPCLFSQYRIFVNGKYVGTEYIESKGSGDGCFVIAVLFYWAMKLIVLGLGPYYAFLTAAVTPVTYWFRYTDMVNNGTSLISLCSVKEFTATNASVVSNMEQTVVFCMGKQREYRCHRALHLAFPSPQSQSQAQTALDSVSGSVANVCVA